MAVKKTNGFGYYYHCINYLTKSFALITFQKFGTDVMHGSKLFAVITWTLSSVRILTDGATRRLVLYMFRLHPGYHNTPVTRRTIDRSIIQMELFSNLLL